MIGNNYSSHPVTFSLAGENRSRGSKYLIVGLAVKMVLAEIKDKGPYAVVVADLKMQGVNGIEIAKPIVIGN